MSLSPAKHHNDFLVSQRERRNQLEFTQKIRLLTVSPILKANASLSVDHEHILRVLEPQELEILRESCGCRCNDWSQVFLLLSPLDEASRDQSSRLRSLISNTNFEGVVVLTLENAVTPADASLDPWRKGPMGIHSNFLISNSIVSLQSWVHSNMVICATHIYPSSVLMGCGSVTIAPNSNNFLANDAELKLTVGPESGGARNLNLIAESCMIDVCQQLTTRDDGGATLKESPVSVANMNVICSHSIVRNTPSIQSIYLSHHSSINAATSVSNAVLLPTASIKNGCNVDNVRLQWNSSIVENSKVSDALLMEEAHIGPNSLVTSAVLGPDVHVSSGEVQCSIIGPSCNAHHQSLVISVLWPLGRGNVGYGSNIGSNHTGRIPDQETTSGEGVFWGLSTVIKFPVDLTMSPYSIIAAGTTLPPQRVCMPFSLIVSSNDSGNNNIIPGWLLASSPYTIARNEKKFATRRKAKRHKHYTGWKIIRPQTINMCRWARKQLENVAVNTEEKPGVLLYVTDSAIRGIGSNILSEKGRRSGIKAYTECIQKFALEGLLDWLTQKERDGELSESSLQSEFSATQVSQIPDDVYDQVTWPSFPWEATPGETCSYQKSVLLEEFPRNSDVASWVVELLQKLVFLEKGYALRIYKSKKRDDQRGAETVPGYAHCHISAENDPVIIESRKKAEEIELRVDQLIGKVKNWKRSKL